MVLQMLPCIVTQDTGYVIFVVCALTNPKLLIKECTLRILSIKSNCKKPLITLDHGLSLLAKYLNASLLGFIRLYLILTRLEPKAGQFCLLMLRQSNVLMEKTSQIIQHPEKEVTKSVTKNSFPPTEKLTGDHQSNVPPMNYTV